MDLRCAFVLLVVIVAGSWAKPAENALQGGDPEVEELRLVTTESSLDGIDIVINQSTTMIFESDDDPESGMVSTTDPSGAIDVTTETTTEIEITMDPESGIDINISTLATMNFTTDPSVEIQVTTEEEFFDEEMLLSTESSATNAPSPVTIRPEEEVETVTPIVFLEGPEATTFLAEANNIQAELEVTTEPSTEDADQVSATTEFADFPAPVVIPAGILPPFRYMIRNKDFSKFLSKKKQYRGYRVLRVLLVTEEAVARVLQMEDKMEGVNFWADPNLLLRPRGRFVTSVADVMVSRKALPAVEEVFRQSRLTYTVLVDDVQDAIDKENVALSPFARSEMDSNSGHQLTWQRYHRLSDIDSFLDYLQESYPDLVDVVEIGQSSQGRPIRLVRLGRQIHTARDADKKSILIDAGVHGNEWITTSSVTWMLNEMSTNQERYDCILDRFDWLWIPLLNPDGYEYTHTVDRMWRKTRRNYTSLMTKARLGTHVQPIGSPDDCVGADINRNFEFYWRKGGSSSNVCSGSFAGIFPFSEPESRALANYVLKHKKEIAMYMSLHAYSQMWLLPWGFSEQKPKDFGRLFSLAKIGASGIQAVHNTTFLIGSVPDLLYRSSGNSQDWLKAVAGVDYSFTLELRDAGRRGMILPANQIVPTAEETWTGIYAAARELAHRFYPLQSMCPSI